jgi:uncharacterized membrane protein YdjX (TVP38/TMEM64 family)
MAQAKNWPKLILLAVLVIAIVVGAWAMLGTETGSEFLHKPHAKGEAFRAWVAGHRVIAPVVFVAVFIAMGSLALPVWWLQILAGYGFGLAMGVALSEIAATIAAVNGAAISRFLLGEWFHTRIESHAARLRALDEKLGHNGLLVVCLVRLMHFIPAGLSNYAFGLTRISFRDIAIGTLLGGLPAVTSFVTIGAARHLLKDWRYLTAIVGINVLLIGMLLARYLKPEWFRRFGVE